MFFGFESLSLRHKILDFSFHHFLLFVQALVQTEQLFSGTQISASVFVFQSERIN